MLSYDAVNIASAMSVTTNDGYSNSQVHATELVLEAVTPEPCETSGEQIAKKRRKTLTSLPAENIFHKESKLNKKEKFGWLLFIIPNLMMLDLM